MKTMHNPKKHRFALLLALVVMFTALPAQWEVFAANSTNLGTATLQILSTTDLHGKSVKYSYDTGLESNGSLAQLVTLIDEKKAGLKNGATLLVDSGDTMYGYGTKQIYDGVVTGDEYMFSIMNQMGYDAITIGNHDFNFGYDYIMRALTNTGMAEKTVLSNVLDSQTRKSILQESLIITKKMTTNKGNRVSVKIGIIGVMTPSIISNAEFESVIEARDILETVEQEAELLSSKTDLIVVLAHSGIGKEAPEEMSDNMVYALSELDDVDVICAGHGHEIFPREGSAYDLYQNVDSETGMMNDTLVIEENDHGQSLGISKIKLKFINGKVKVTSKKASVQEVTPDVAESQKVLQLDSAYAAQYSALYAKSLAKLRDTDDENGYFGTIEDNALIQAINETKIRYGMQAIESEKEYQQYPVIAATTYAAGGKTGKDYLSTDGNVTVEDCLNLQEFGHNMAVAYEVKGKELREALEWEAARLFQTSGDTQGAWSDSLVVSGAAMGNVPMLTPEAMDSWAGYGVYEIDTSVPPRYDVNGNLINDTHRIVSLTQSGRTILNEEILVLVTSKNYIVRNPLYGSTFSNDRKILNNGSHLETYLENYVQEMSAQGEFNVKPDNNFKVKFDPNVNYIVKSSEGSQQYALTRDWYQSTLGTENGYAYYLAHFTDKADTSGPLLVLASLKETETNKPITVKVQFSDRSGVASIQYMKGVYALDANEWSRGIRIQDRRFEVSENGTYSVLATDNAGNRTVKYITISNYNAGILELPQVQAFTNKKTMVTGTAEPGATVNVQIDGETYSAVAMDSGSFSCEVGYHNADRTLTAWQSLNGKKSGTYSATVLRRGGNLPSLDAYTNTTLALTGNLNDGVYCYPIAICGSNVFVPSDRKSLYLESQYFINHEDKVPVYCDYSYNSTTQKFSFSMPARYANQKVNVYVLDWMGRTGGQVQFQVAEAGPNLPALFKVIAEEGTVYGQIPGVVSGQSYKVYAETDEDVYSADADANGYFAIQTGKLEGGQTFTVTAEDTVNGQQRESAPCEGVASFASLYAETESEIELEEITNKSLDITGYIDLSNLNSISAIHIALATENDLIEVEPDELGDFTVDLDEELTAGSNVYLFVRDEQYQLADVKQAQVVLEKPEAPEILTDEIRAKTTKKVKVYCYDQATAVVKVGSQYYEVADCKYKSSYGGYIYTIQIDPQQLKAKQVFSVYMLNEAGKSKTVKMKVKKNLTPKKNKKAKNKKTTK